MPTVPTSDSGRRKAPSSPLRVALVTGANRGIGFEVCRQLADRGYMVLLGARDGAKGKTAARKLGANVTPLILDVADAATITRAVDEIANRYGHLDTLINNAAVHYDDWQTAVNADWNIVHEAFDVNVFGPWRLIQACMPLLRKAREGRIVNVSSEAGSARSAGTGPPAYSTSKAALNALTRILAAELRGSGILVNAVCPGWTNTEMGKGGRPVAEGAASVMWAIDLPEGGPTGGFFRDGRAISW